MSELLKRLKKSSSIKSSAILSKSSVFGNKNITPTTVPMINVALSGKLDGGLSSGLTVLAGPSKHFKTAFGLLMMKAYLEADKDAVALFYDSEFGSPPEYFESLNIDPERVLHVPIKNIEELKFDIVNQLDELKSDKVFIMIDSIGNLASKKEIDDAMDGKSVADMTRAKQLKSLFRMVTPYLSLKDIPLVAVNHTYETQEMFSKQVVSGGTGVMYSADNVWIIGRRQVKKGTVIDGYDFIINVEKSRFVKEKSKIPISVTWEGGIKKYSGLLDVAVEGNYIAKPSNGWYQIVDRSTGEMIGTKLREKDTHTSEFWDPLLDSEEFQKFIADSYSIGGKSLMSFDEEEIDPELREEQDRDYRKSSFD